MNIFCRTLREACFKGVDVSLERRGGPSLYLSGRETGHLKDGDPASQRFREGRHHLKLLRASEPVHPTVIFPLQRTLIYDPLHFEQKRGCTLEFIDEQRKTIGFKEEGRVTEGKIAGMYVIEGDILPLALFDLEKHGFLAHPPLSTDHHHRIEAACFQNMRFKMAWYVHAVLR